MPVETASVTKFSSKSVPLVSFVNGTIKENRKRCLTMGLFKDLEKGQKKKPRLLIAESSKMIYQGSSRTPSTVGSGSSRLYVAQVNRQKGKVTMFPAELFNLHPVIEGDLQREQVDLGSMSFREKADMLTDAFGSGKQKRALAKRQRNKLVEEAVSSAMGSAIDTAVTAQQALTPVSKVQESSSSGIPPHNKDAETPAEVYDLNSIIGLTEMENLKTPAQELFESSRGKIVKWQEEKKYFPSVLSRLRILPVEEEARWKSACCLLYLQYMMTLYLTKYDQLRKKDPLPEGWPDVIKRFLLGRFMLIADKKRCIPARLRDLLLSHILVLCLIQDHFTVSLSQLQEDLKLSNNKLLTHVRALGCKVKAETKTNSDGVKVTSHTALLTVPLTFPAPSKAKKAKR